LLDRPDGEPAWPVPAVGHTSHYRNTLPMESQAFPVLILLGRPAAGKSEIIDYLKRFPAGERLRRFHIGEMKEIDDFPLLWAWFEEDDILAKMGHPRLHSTPDGYFIRRYLWDVLIQRLGLEYDKWCRDAPADSTAIVEFSRGTEHGGYRSAFANLSPAILESAGVLYVQVSWQQCLLKNRRRFNPQRPDSILEHGLSDAKLERLYGEVDWDDLAAGDPTYLSIQGRRVPYAVFENEDDVTTPRGDALGQRLEVTLGRLWSARAGCK
jgi:hypothetical protein